MNQSNSVETLESYDDFENMTFLNEELFKGICNYGFKYPSQIQSKTIHCMMNF